MTASTDAARRRRHRNERIVAACVVLVVAAAAAATAWWSRSLAKDASRAYLPGNTPATPEITLLQEYVRIDTSTPRGAAAGARWLADRLRERGIQPELIVSAPDRINVYARIRGRRPGNGLLLFNHIDVVPAPGTWTHPPFAGTIAMNQLYGRGAVDMKGLAICQLLAFADLAQETPEHDVVFLATADEETGSQFGMQWLIVNRPDVFANVRYGITEGGITEVITERMVYFGVEVGGKQFVEMIFEGHDAESLRAARFALEPLMFPREPQRILPSVRRYFQNIAPTRVAYRKLLADIDATIAQGDFWRLPEPYRDLTQNSVWASAPRQESGRWVMTVRQANLPDEKPADRIAAVERIVAPHGVRLARVTSRQGPVPVSREDTPVFEELVREARQRYGVDAGAVLLYRSTSDARFLRPRGIECYGVSPYPVNFFQSRAIHGVDERIQLDWYLEGVGYMRRVVAAWAGRRS